MQSTVELKKNIPEFFFVFLFLQKGVQQWVTSRQKILEAIYWIDKVGKFEFTIKTFSFHIPHNADEANSIRGSCLVHFFGIVTKPI